MARIRSVHPGLTSDEAYMSMSMAAKAGWAPLWMQCDDHGIFEWKPIVLKALIFPADAVDFAALLEEWLALGCIRKIEIEGKPCGLVRSFAKYQRPKNPSYRYFKKAGELPADYSQFIGLKVVPAPPVLPQPSPSPTEIPPQRKEEGGSGGGEERAREPDQNLKPGPERGKSLISVEAFEVSTQVLIAMGLDPAHPLSVGAPLTVQGWFNVGLHPDHILIGVRRAMAKRGRDPPSTLAYFEKPILRAKAELSPTMPVLEASDVQAGSEQPSLRLLRTVPSKGGGYARIAAKLGTGQSSG